MPEGRSIGKAVILLLPLCALLAAPPAPAMETDPFLALDAEIEDSSEALNTFVNQVVERRLDRLNRRFSAERKQRLACEDVTFHLLFGFRKTFYTKVARWAHNDPAVDRFPDESIGRKGYYRRSILGLPYYFHFQIPLGRTVNVDGVYLGVDKLGHFFSFGARYYRWYLRELERGATPAEAERQIILRGLRWEYGIVGRWTTGVVSFGDLEANYQGFRLARSLCDGSGPGRLELDAESDWVLRGTIDVRDYVNPDWDEAFNPNVYTKRRWKKIKQRVAQYCDKLDDAEVVERFTRYGDGYRPSLNMRIVRDLERLEVVPHRETYTLEEVCSHPERELPSVSGLPSNLGALSASPPLEPGE